MAKLKSVMVIEDPLVRRAVFYGPYIAASVFIATIMFIVLRNTIFYPLVILPPIFIIAVVNYVRSQTLKEQERGFSTFLNDLKDLLQGGMPLVNALEVTSRNDYGKFSVLVKKLAGQIKLGVSFEKALEDVLRGIDSAMVQKTIYVIGETHKRGGNLINVFNATAKYVTEIERLKQQRKSTTYSSLFTSYFMFFVFLGIIIAILAFFLPLTTQTSVFQQTSGPAVNFKQYFLYLLVIQSLFAGPMIGKISENSLASGIIHTLVLLSVTIPIYVVATAFIA